MSHYLPVFFFRVDESQIPEKLETWEDAVALLEDGLTNPRQFGLRESTSRNWWHQNTLDLLCQGLQIDGLGFVNSEVACLRGDDLREAAEALGAVLSSVADGIPNLGQFEADIEWLRIPEHRSAIEQAKPRNEISTVEAGWGLEAAIGFYSFVKSLREAVREAIAENQCVLYVSVQP